MTLNQQSVWDVFKSINNTFRHFTFSQKSQHTWTQMLWRALSYLGPYREPLTLILHSEIWQYRTVRYIQVVLKAIASGKQWKEEVSNAAYATFVFIQQTQSNKTSMEITTSHNTFLTKYLWYTLNWLHYFFFYFTFVYFKNKVPCTTCSTLVYHQCCAYHRLKTM